MNESRVVLVVPCYNEGLRLRRSVFVDYATTRPWVTFLFVDDGSTDATSAVLAEIQSLLPSQSVVLRLEANKGKAEAVRRGILGALEGRPDLVGYWDADLSTPLEALDDFVALLAKRPDVEIVLGSRVMLLGRDIRRNPVRHYLGRLFATAASLVLDLPVYDTQCGAKLLRKTDQVARVFAEPFCSSWIFDVELLARYLSAETPPGEAPRQARLYELALPVWHDVPGSKLKPLDFIRAMAELVSIWRRQRPRG